MKIPVTKPFFDQNEIEKLTYVLNSGWVAQGPTTEMFERKTASHEGIKYAVATSNCTTALHLALLANGVGVGQDVLVPAFTFIATANAVTYTGAVPIFVDINLETYNISVECIQKTIEKKYIRKDNKLINKVTNNTLTCILPVHQFGLCAEMLAINEIAKKNGLTIIEDAACALGAKIQGINQGCFGNMSCVSFHPRKCITTGEGGMIFTEDYAMYIKLKKLRSHGASVSEVNRNVKNDGFLLPSFSELGYNFRLSDIQSAMGLAQIEKIDFILKQRRYLAKEYMKMLEECDWLYMPNEPDGYYHTYQSFVCRMRADEKNVGEKNSLRNNIMLYLAEKGVQTRQGTHALHMLNYYKNKYSYSEESFYNAYVADQLTIALPLFVNMDASEQNYVVEQLKKAYKELV